MSLNLSELILFCEAFEKKLQSNGYVRNPQTFHKIVAWQSLLQNNFADYLKKYHQRLINNKPYSVGLDFHNRNLQALINVIKNASIYLQKHSVPQRLWLLENYARFILQIYQQNFSTFQLDVPTSLMHQQDAGKDEKKWLEEREPKEKILDKENKSRELQQFLKNDPAFTALKVHREQLLHDKRDHRFFGYSFVVANKSSCLHQLLEDLSRSCSLKQLRRKLMDFFLSKGLENSLYEKINKGQNITTRLCGLRTRSLELIEKMYHAIPAKETEMVDNARDDFIDSSLFEMLKNYRFNVLHHDKRSHSFLGYSLAVKEKASILQALIQDLCAASSMVEIRGKLDTFYLGQGIAGSDYELLNTGQNICSRVLGLKTTTLEIIDRLQSLAYENSFAEQTQPGMRYRDFRLCR